MPGFATAAPSALFDDNLGTGGALHLTRCIDTFRCTAPAQIDATFAAIEAARAAGHWVAIAAAYELGYALEPCLAALRPHTAGRLHVVSGAGGDRDPGKRPLMGKVAAELGDHVIVTDDNPRSEDPDVIRAAIMAGAPKAEEIAGRRAAIAAAVAQAGADDIVLLAGKGHEQGQIIGERVLPFDDVTVARECAQ